MEGHVPPFLNMFYQKKAYWDSTFLCQRVEHSRPNSERLSQLHMSLWDHLRPFWLHHSYGDQQLEKGSSLLITEGFSKPKTWSFGRKKSRKVLGKTRWLVYSKLQDPLLSLQGLFSLPSPHWCCFRECWVLNFFMLSCAQVSHGSMKGT